MHAGRGNTHMTVEIALMLALHRGAEEILMG